MSEDSQAGALIGVVLANSYELTRFIGRGGMGAVYEGRHLRLGQRVAIKVMSAELTSNREALARFRREAEVTSRIGHPHIVHVFDFGSARTGEPFLVMEYLDGEDLDRRIMRLGRLSMDETLHVVKQTAAALAAAHAKGVVHRDLKPANVFLLNLGGEADFVKLVDFGISKVKAISTRLTRSSVVMGTPDYMSPEQAQGRSEEIDHQTDQWALAAMTYEMLCGKAPFAGEDVASVLYQVTHEPPRPLSDHVPGFPAEIERVVLHALAKRPADRFPDVTAFVRALEEAAARSPSVARPLPAPRSFTHRQATVAYGALDVPSEDSPDTWPDPAPDSPGPSQNSQPARRTTFSHATGEARVPFNFRRLGGRPAILATAISALTLTAWLLARPDAGSRSSQTRTAEQALSGQSTPPARRAPRILPIAAPPPTFVGPPLPPLDELDAARAAAEARAARIKAELAALPEWQAPAPSVDTVTPEPVAITPEPPAATPAPPPALDVSERLANPFDEPAPDRAPRPTSARPTPTTPPAPRISDQLNP